MNSARATAHSNIALVKYWGKRVDANPDLNLPAVGSLSLTLDELRTETTLEPGETDQFELDGEPVLGNAADKVFRHLDRMCAGPRPACRVTSRNHLPTAAGLASSASGFAALTVAANAALDLGLGDTELSSMARRGSGSAARSIWGGFVRLDRGGRADGVDCLAHQIFAPDHWDIRLVVAQTAVGPKAVGSTDGMERCRETSPYYRAWVETSRADMDSAQEAIAARDLDRLGAVMEHSCFKMHACMMATQPALLYWNGTTVAAINAVTGARADGHIGFITIDAGPHVKVLCEAEHAPAIVERLSAVEGVTSVQALRAGPSATVEVMA